MLSGFGSKINKFFEKFVNNLRVWSNPKHANKSFKHISIVYDRLARGYGKRYFEPFAYTLNP